MTSDTTANTLPKPAAPWISRIRVAVGDIKLAHTVFALPFAVLAAVLALVASQGLVPTVTPDAVPDTPGGVTGDATAALVLVVAAMFFARTWAMLVNRLADHSFDRDNPRTARRAVASGRLSVRDGWLIASGCALCFLTIAAGFYLMLANVWPLVLSLPVLLWIALYSYTKRFTAAAHFFLGSALAISPVCAAIAVWPGVFGLDAGSLALASGEGERWTDAGTSIALLAGFVALWVAGFDIAYALQDLVFDRERGLRSVPALLGHRGSLWASRATHVCAFGLLVGAWLAGPSFGVLFGGAVAAVGALLIYEHAVLARRGLAGLPMAFFTVNGVVSCVLGAAGVVDALT